MKDIQDTINYFQRKIAKGISGTRKKHYETAIKALEVELRIMKEIDQYKDEKGRGLDERRENE